MDSIELENVVFTKKKFSLQELSSFSKEELVEKVIQLQAHNVQLKNLIMKKVGLTSTVTSKKGRPFDFSKCPKEHVFLRVLYLGWDYQGFATQEDTDQTIEHHLMKALVKCKLIESRDTSNYHRCGRTDKGVSSFGQVISLTVRTAEPGQPPLPMCKMLNRLLPNEIRVLGWCPAPEGASARFDCKFRVYKYYFPRSDLNVQAMKEAAHHLIGNHDFRNLCKMDVGNNVTNFRRSVKEADVTTVNDDHKGYQMCELTIIGNAFLWHQIRCIVSLLVLVGQGLEEPSIIVELLDVEKNPRKPQYVLACPMPLNLFKCEFEYENWQFEPNEIEYVVETLQKHWTEHQIKAVQVRAMLNELEPLLDKNVNGQICTILRRESKTYKPLLDRQKCQSLEDRIEHYAKRRKISQRLPENMDTLDTSGTAT